MSKKNKRQSRRESTPAPVTFPSTPGVQNRPNEFAPDYGYVRKDLRRIGTIWGSFIAILIVLSFFLH